LLESLELGPKFNFVLVTQEHVDILAEKWTQYFTYLTGGAKFYIGRNLRLAHERLQITDKEFDFFISICT